LLPWRSGDVYDGGDMEKLREEIVPDEDDYCDPDIRDIRCKYHLVDAKVKNQKGDKKAIPFQKWLNLTEVVNVILFGMRNPWITAGEKAEFIDWTPEKMDLSRGKKKKKGADEAENPPKDRDDEAENPPKDSDTGKKPKAAAVNPPEVSDTGREGQQTKKKENPRLLALLIRRRLQQLLVLLLWRSLQELIRQKECVKNVKRELKMMKKMKVVRMTKMKVVTMTKMKVVTMKGKTEKLKLMMKMKVVKMKGKTEKLKLMTKMKVVKMKGKTKMMHREMIMHTDRMMHRVCKWSQRETKKRVWTRSRQVRKRFQRTRNK
jgi:hypothetical protein